jgi:hypothetical protein
MPAETMDEATEDELEPDEELLGEPLEDEPLLEELELEEEPLAVVALVVLPVLDEELRLLVLVELDVTASAASMVMLVYEPVSSL